MFFLSALFDPNVEKHQILTDLKWEVYRKTAKVLLLGEFDIEDPKYKMCFATLSREAEFEPDLVSKAIELYLQNNKRSLVESGLMRSKNDARWGLTQIWGGEMWPLKALAYCKSGPEID